jgi:acetyl-CoA synthetase
MPRTGPGPGRATLRYLLPMSEIDSVLHEDRRFPPPPGFAARARLADEATYRRLHRESIEQPEVFWDRVAKELPWMQPYQRVLEWQAPDARWFVGGKLNASAVCLDRHLGTPTADKTALIFEGEPGDLRRLTYRELHGEVNKAANALKARGLKRGDRVAIYMPLVPELIVAVLACARLGVIHSVVFGGFSAQALRDRILDGGCSAVITADGGFRRGKPMALKPAVDEAVQGLEQVHTVLVVRRTGQPVFMGPKDVWWHQLVGDQPAECAPEAMDSEDTLFLLYTSGSTGRPKGIQHSTGGYLVGAYLSFGLVFDHRPEDVYWCSADVGWVTGHSYVVYGPLANGATVLIYEGAPNAPHEGRFWELIQKHRVSIFYTAPTAIRTFMRWGDQHPQAYDLSSLRLLGTVGEPINPEAWIWYHETIGGRRCPIVDTWWQTETGGIMIAPLPGVTVTKPGSATRPFFGVDAAIVDEAGRELPAGHGGYLVIRRPWPSMLRGVWGDRKRFIENYWTRFPGIYFPGDGARQDSEGYFWILGRVDDVLNVSGHRLSTMEVESALVSHEQVVEAAVVARPDPLTGEAICAFVTPAKGALVGPELVAALQAHVVKEIGALARPAEIRFSDALPKTRSGKIMRRLLRDVAAGRETTGDTSTIEDLSVLAKLRQDED